MIQDRKTIRPWIRGSPEPDFVRGTMRLWVLLGIYTGVLTVLLFVGLGLRHSYPSPLAPPQATVAHLGADAFAIMLYTDDRIGDAQGIALRIMERLREPIALDGGSVHVRASMGVVCAPAADTAIIDILRDADSALNLVKVDGVIARCGLLAGELRLELTETAVITNIDAASSVLPALRERHIPLYMDDFGTGYSSLSYLNELPFDVLKIDRSFITEIETRNQSQILVRTVLALAQAMGLDVVAEGIETEGQATLLHAMGCRYGQGYYFSRPVAAELAETWLA